MSLIVLNLENGESFVKYFENPYMANKFKNKLKYSKKLKVVGEANGRIE